MKLSEQEWKEFYHRNINACIRRAMRAGLPRESAEEVANDALLKAQEKATRTEDLDRFARQNSLTLGVDRYRRERRHHETMNNQPTASLDRLRETNTRIRITKIPPNPEDIAIMHETMEETGRLIEEARLSPTELERLSRAAQGQRPKDIAQEEGVSQTTVNTSLSRTRQKLREARDQNPR